MCKNISLYKMKNNNNKNINNILKQYYIVCSSRKECSDELVIKITNMRFCKYKKKRLHNKK